MFKRAFTVFLAALLLDLFNIVLDKITKFVIRTGFQQIRSAIGFLYNVFVKVNPGKSLKRLLPLFITSIYKEININKASTMADMEILLRDRILMWNIYLFSYSLTEIGDFVLT